MSTILIVDDDENCRKLWGEMFKDMATLVYAGTLEEAFTRMSEIPPPDLVLLDLKLPPYTEEHTLPAVRALREFNPDLKVLAVSGMLPDEIHRAIAIAGVDIQGVFCKGEFECQSRLLSSVRGLLATISPKAALETVQDAIEKKRTDRINLE